MDVLQQAEAVAFLRALRDVGELRLEEISEQTFVLRFEAVTSVRELRENLFLSEPVSLESLFKKYGAQLFRLLQHERGEMFSDKGEASLHAKSPGMKSPEALSPLNLRNALDAAIRPAIAKVTGLDIEQCDPILAVAKNPKFGDYQANAMMGLAKLLKRSPRDIATEVESELQNDERFCELVEKVEVAGPGFLNLHLNPSEVEKRVNSGEIAKPQTLAPSERQTVVVDYSSPNVAKEMHVGHIRSTLLGDSISRVLDHLGHKVIRQNHLGDWGTQFGMLIAFYREHPECLEDFKLEDIEQNYRRANELFTTNAEFQAKAKLAVVQLHEGQQDEAELWNRIVELSKQHIHSNYQRLGVKLTPDDDCGESFYNPQLPEVIGELTERFQGVDGPMTIKIDEGAVCVYLSDEKGDPLFLNSEDEPLPFLIQKSDGAFLYASTDLAALKYRASVLKADWTIYVTDNRQALHFEMLFAVAQQAGLDRETPESPAMKLQHITFGTILGADKKPLKTRDGGNVKLSELIAEAVERSLQRVPDEATEGGESKEDIAKKIGVGSLKYADLSQNRLTDYVFTWEKLLALEGNTAPYLLFAYARLSAILRKAEETFNASKPLKIQEPAERNLAILLCRFPETVESLSKEWRMNALTDYLYLTASSVMKFLETCRVLDSENPETQHSRLRLCKEAQDVLRAGLDLLGIETVERM